MDKYLKELDVIVGTWKSAGETIAHENEKSIKVKGTDAYQWLPGKQYMIHRIDVLMGQDKVHAIEIIGGLDKSKKAFAMHAFQNDTGHSVMWASKHKDGAWLFAGDEMRAILTLPKDGQAMSAKWERRVGSKWVHWMDMRFSK